MDGLMVQQPLVPMVWTPYGWMPLEEEAPEFMPGTEICFDCPITNNSGTSVKCKVKVQIYEGSFMPGHGTKLAEYDSDEHTIGDGATYEFRVPSDSPPGPTSHTTEKGTIDRRDVGVVLYYYDPDADEWKEYGSEEWDDHYYVIQVSYEFIIGKPTVHEAS